MKRIIQNILLASAFIFSSVASVKTMEKQEKNKKDNIIKQAEYVLSQLTNNEIDKYRTITHDWQTLAPGSLQISIDPQFEALAILQLAQAKEKNANKKVTANIKKNDLLCNICNTPNMDINKKLSYIAAIVVSTKNFNALSITKLVKNQKFVALMTSATGILALQNSFATHMGY